MLQGDGDILVFLPGMEEILRLHQMVEEQQHPSETQPNIIRLHSDLLGEGEDTQDNAESRGNMRGTKLYLSTLVAAR